MDKVDTRRIVLYICDLVRTNNCSMNDLDNLLKGKDTKSIFSEKIYDHNLVTFSCERNQLHLVKYFIDVCKLDIDARYEFPRVRGGCSMLCWACNNLKYDLVNLLINLGADVNSRDSFGKQPLHHLCSNSAYDQETDHSITRLVGHLINKGADVNSTTDSGETPLLFACLGFHAVEVCKKLHSHNAEINASDDNGNSSLHYYFSCYTGYDNGELLNVLQQFGANINRENNEGKTPVDILIKRWCDIYTGFSCSHLGGVFPIVQNYITLNRKYHMMEILGAMSAWCVDLSFSVRFWTKSAKFRSSNPDSECCRNTRTAITNVFHNTEEYKNSEKFSFSDRSECLKQAIIKSYRHLGFNYHLTLILCQALLDFYQEHSLITERMTFFTNMLDFIMKEGRYLDIKHERCSTSKDLLLSFSEHWFEILRDLDYFETEYTQKLVTVLLHFLKTKIHNAPLDIRFGYIIFDFIRHFSDGKDKIPKEVTRLLRNFIQLEVQFVTEKSNIVNGFSSTDLIGIVCESVREKRSAILQVLLNHGMSANEIDEDGNTALHKYL